jgi:hypothetical protein
MKRLNGLGVLFGLGFLISSGVYSEDCQYKNYNYLIGEDDGVPVARMLFEPPLNPNGKFVPNKYKEMLFCERPGGKGSYAILTEHIFNGMITRNPPEEVLGIDTRNGYFSRIYLNGEWTKDWISSGKNPHSMHIVVTPISELSYSFLFLKRPSLVAGMPHVVREFEKVESLDPSRGKFGLGQLSVAPNPFVLPVD